MYSLLLFVREPWVLGTATAFPVVPLNKGRMERLEATLPGYLRCGSYVKAVPFQM
jgi:hypothetical protein